MATERSKQIDSRLRTDAETASKQVKLLLLGKSPALLCLSALFCDSSMIMLAEAKCSTNFVDYINFVTINTSLLCDLFSCSVEHSSLVVLVSLCRYFIVI